MSAETNLFGDVQERPQPALLRASFEINDPYCCGVCVLTPEQLDSEDSLLLPVVEWEMEPDWEMPELSDCSRSHMWLYPKYECEALDG